MKQFHTIFLILLFITCVGENVFAQYETKLIPNDGDAGDFFGSSVGIYGDYAIVGAFEDDENGTKSGSAYIFKRNGLHNWMQQQKLLASDGAADDEFGSSVTICGDYAMVGAYHNDNTNGSNAGAVYVFKRNGEIWEEQTKLIASDGDDHDSFGYSVSISGSYACISAKSYNVNEGGAYIFKLEASNWVEKTIITASDVAYQDYFGESVSISGDRVIIGSKWDDDLGSESGSAYVFVRSGESWSEEDKLLPSDGTADDEFGRSVCLSGDYAVIGAWAFWGDQIGSAYIFERSGSTWSEEIILNPVEGETSDFIGMNVSIWGNYSSIGASGDDDAGSNSGAVYLYEHQISGWTRKNKLTASDAENGMNFSITDWATGGHGVSSWEAYLIVGAMDNDARGNNSGSAYIYDLFFTPPSIDTVKDVPNDQGGFVTILWQATNIDTNVNEMTHYSIWRALPQGTQPTGRLVTGSEISFDFNESAYRMLSFNGDSYAWEWVANQPAHKFTSYSYTATTLYDSSSNTDGKHYFLVSAHTSDLNIFYDSEADSGYSVDNLAPLPPEAFYANLNGAEVKLGWEANTEPDLRDYYIYRSDTPVGDELTLIGTTTDTIFIDSSPLSGTSYYYIQAYDIHENGSPFSEATIDVVLSANIKIFLEGPYLAGNMSINLNTFGFIPLDQPYYTTPWEYLGTETVGTIPTGVVDWVLVELRSDLTTMVSRKAGFLKSDGSIVDLDGVSLLNFPSVSNGDYYVAIYHRNHLAIMTASPIALSETPSLYDYTTAQTQAYGTNAMVDLGGGDYGMYSADGDGDGGIYGGDYILYQTAQGNEDYLLEDYDLDGGVYGQDYILYQLNQGFETWVPPVTE